MSMSIGRISARRAVADDVLGLTKVFRAPDGFVIALTYSSKSEWGRNVLAATGCELKTRGKKYQLRTEGRA